MLDRLVTALVAMSLACLVWLYARSRDQETLDNVPVPVEISLTSGQSENYDLEVTGPSQILASFTGPPSYIRDLRGILQSGELRVEVTLTVPPDRLEESRYLDTVRVDASDIRAPAGVTPMVVEGRNRIPVILHRLVERPLRVRLESISDASVSQAIIKPATVIVRGPQDILDHVREIPTQPQAFTSRIDPATGQEVISARSVPLVTELEGRRIRTTPSSVEVQITIQPQQRVYDLTDVPVQFLCPANFPLRPLCRDERAGKIALRVRGPAGAEAPTVVAFIDLCGKKWEPGLYEEALKLQLPTEFQLAQNPPRMAAFQLLPIDAGARSLGSTLGP